MTAATHAVTGSGGRARELAALLVGVALGAGMTAGHALLLYTGQGFLGAAGWLLSLSLLSLAAGLWAGVPTAGRRAGRARWTWAVFAWGSASLYATFQGLQGGAGQASLRGALAALLVLAHPAYTSGLVLGALTPGRRTGIAPVALASCALGVLVAALLLIPRFNAGTIALSAAGLVAAAAAIGTTRSQPETADMQGKVVLVTGVGDRGQVGYVIARRFLEAGARILITARSASVDELAGELGVHGEVAAVRADLTVEADVERLIATARERFGRLDALINVAGGLSVIKPVAETTPEEFQRETARNAATVHMVCRAALPLLREGGGTVVNFASPAGERAVARLGAYSAAKAAVIALTRALALEEKPNGVRVNAIAPGMIDTAQNRAEDADRTKWVTREDIAELVLFLAGPGSAAVSGETIHAPGDTLR